MESFGVDCQRGSGSSDLQSNLINYDFDQTFDNFSTKITTNVSNLTSFTKTEGIGIGAAVVFIALGSYDYYNSTVNKHIRSNKRLNYSISNTEELNKSFDDLSFDQQRQIKKYMDVYGADDFLKKFGSREGYFNPTVNFEKTLKIFLPLGNKN